MKKRILIVDDNYQIVRNLKWRLEAHNFDVSVAYDGYECVHLAKLELPDLILMDIKMPIGGGLWAFETLKGMADTSKIPIIFNTEFPSTEVRKLVMEMGAEDLIWKPFKSDVVIEKINTALSYKMIIPDDQRVSDSAYSQDSLETN